MEKREIYNRWRLILGKDAQADLPMGAGFDYREIDEALDFLYSREYEERQHNISGEGMEGGQGASQLTVPEWISHIRRLFPLEIVHRLENEALERYQLTEMLTDKRVLEQMQPNMQLLKTILSLKGRMRGEVLHVARNIVRQVVEELKKKLEMDIRASFSGKLDRSRSSPLKLARNLDIKKTIRKNLKHYDPQFEALVLERVYFSQRIKSYNPWHIVLCIDQSGSMMDSLIYASIMAAIFAKLPALSVRIVLFDTEIVDVSGYVDDPVEVLMSVQLGGGTDIGKALSYCETLIETPSRTITVLVSDLCDGFGYTPMYAAAARLIEAGSRLFVLTAMDENARGIYDKNAAEQLAAQGADVASVTPGKLADWVASVVQGR